uniref:Cyclic nucleotide-binding domain-containing protein n=1 Tax=Chrysotila carterae TaxID=13221 RepID=A0A7S4F1E8_CHRCT|mmetsp:Transcript_39238/g.86243  ORF Transcript_39238/g.86243 Transcript_39238/m.86243 type:complete len:685 (+) Transcript_39238:103-2157(+)
MLCCGGGGDGEVETERKQELLAQCTPFGVYFDSAQLAKLAKLFARQRFIAGQDLPESPFYIVAAGEVEVISKFETGFLCVKQQGSFFSRHAGIVYGPANLRSSGNPRNTGNPRDRRNSFIGRVLNRGTAGTSSPAGTDADDASCTEIMSIADPMMHAVSFRRTRKALEEATTRLRCKVNSEVLLVPENRIDDFFDNCQDYKQVINMLMTASLEHQLSQVPFIRAARLSANKLRALGEMCSYKALQRGIPVFHQGDVSDSFYIVLQGDVSVTIDLSKIRPGSTTSDKERLVNAPNRQTGDSFGVSALIFGTPRKYSANAEDKTLLLVISKANFARFIEVAPKLKEALLSTTKSFLLQRYAAMDIPFLQSLPPDVLDKAARVSEIVNLRPGDVVMRQGDPPSRFFLVLDGEILLETVPKRQSPRAQHSSDDSELLGELVQSAHSARLHPGQYFGEVGVLLPSTPLVATATASTKGALLAIKAEFFTELFGADRQLLSEMLIKLLRFDCPLKVGLEHTRCRGFFAAHLDKEVASESLHFHDAVRPLLSGEQQLTVEKAESLCAEYVDNGSTQQVNLSHPMQQAVLKACDSKSIEEIRVALLRANKEIYDLMSRDNWQRFVRGPVFIGLLDELGTYCSTRNELVAELDVDAVTRIVQAGRSVSSVNSAISPREPFVVQTPSQSAGQRC